MAAARAVLEREGIQGLTVRRIAASAGLSNMAMYRHFADKKALLSALTDDGLTAWAEIVRSLHPEIALAVSALCQGLLSMHRAGRFSSEEQFKVLYRSAVGRIISKYEEEARLPGPEIPNLSRDALAERTRVHSRNRPRAQSR